MKIMTSLVLGLALVAGWAVLSQRHRAPDRVEQIKIAAPNPPATRSHSALPVETRTPPAATAMDVDSVSQLRLELERALVSIDEQKREDALLLLLPRLIALNASEAALIAERCEPGPMREELLRRVAQAWVESDAQPAQDWIASLQDLGERKLAAEAATSALARSDTARAIALADRFAIGRDDGTVEHLAQLWFAENPTAALNWIKAQPAGAHRDQLMARLAFAQGASRRVSEDQQP